MKSSAHRALARPLRCRSLNCAYFSLSRHLLSTSSTSPSNSNSKSTEIPKSTVYVGPYEYRIRHLRRISLLSSLLSTVCLPLGIYFDLGTTMPMAGQIAIATTVIISSVSSTFFLHMICSPYVTSLQVLNYDPGNPKDTTVAATRINIFGFSYQSRFAVKDMKPVKAYVHPFSSFKIGNDYYYIFYPNFTDDNSKQLLAIKS